MIYYLFFYERNLLVTVWVAVMMLLTVIFLHNLSSYTWGKKFSVKIKCKYRDGPEKSTETRKG